MKHLLYNGQCCLKKKGCCKYQEKLSAYDWLSDIPEVQQETKYVEVQFKNTRKDFFLNSENLELEKGDMVAVEAITGHDVGIVTLTGQLVLLQMKRHRVRPETKTRRIYRKARALDISRYNEAKMKEHDTMIRARKIAKTLGLQMKIGDVEYQGDGSRAIFYYIADTRVDFRQLIKDLADVFKVRIEMKQIGVRQEAGRIGGIGPCGRELCCSGWICNFVSVSTSAVRIQDIAPNPYKLAGQCAKLKCCLNYEVNSYVEAQRKFPSREIHLETEQATYYHFKTDVFKNQIQYSTEKHAATNLVTISVERAYEVIRQNKSGEKPFSLTSDEKVFQTKREYHDILDDSLTRFDSATKKRGEAQGGFNRSRSRRPPRTPKNQKKR
jgi:cell fate regulator YaaT (PSP1 superfamily)